MTADNPFALSLKEAASFILNGNIIAYPTETVYGLGCNALDNQACQRLQELKKRSIQQSFIILVANTKQAQQLIHPKAHHQLSEAAKTWPGPYTWVFQAQEHLPAALTLQGKIALRISAHPLAQRLCALTETPIISTSANLKNQQPLGDAKTIYTTFSPHISGIMRGEPGHAKPSRIIDAETMQVLRN